MVLWARLGSRAPHKEEPRSPVHVILRPQAVESASLVLVHFCYAKGRRKRILRCRFVLAKSASLCFRLTAKTRSAPLLVLSRRRRKLRIPHPAASGRLRPLRCSGSPSERRSAFRWVPHSTSLGSCCVKDGGYGFFAVAQNDGGKRGAGPGGGMPGPFTPSVRQSRTAPPSRGSYHGAPGRRAPQKRAASLHHVLTYRVKRGRCKSSARCSLSKKSSISWAFSFIRGKISSRW